jgi:hypothetical protein
MTSHRILVLRGPAALALLHSGGRRCVLVAASRVGNGRVGVSSWHRLAGLVAVLVSLLGVLAL